ncbi:MAG: multicopper oxidase domain-containing protein [Gammaproteobacteria bacterium]|nr:multicopper oxidase domain-containing protein [Gammaproteobacteria bacterium]
MKLSAMIKAGMAGLLALAAGVVFSAANAATINVTRCVGSLNKTLSGQTVTFWGFGTGGMMCTGALPGAAIEVGVYPAGSGMSDTLNLTLSINGMTPQENAPYNGHTIHLHGADVATAEDGVPETGAAVGGDTYTWTPTSEMAGSYLYHCHVHTVKHLEMGMYGALIARPKNTSGVFLNQLTHNTATAFDYVQNYVFGSVDPAYHTATGDSTVFADYNPVYFLISGNQGLTTSAPAMTLAAAVNKKVALRLLGLHSVNGTFAVKDGSGNAKSFTVYTQDGRELSAPQTVTSLDVSPGQRFDIVFTTPATTGTWYPQITYKNLRNGTAYTNGTVYGRVTF